jgi:hypothetical protein
MRASWADQLSGQTGLHVSCFQSFVGGIPWCVAGIPWGRAAVLFQADDEPAREVLRRLISIGGAAKFSGTKLAPGLRSLAGRLRRDGSTVVLHRSPWHVLDRVSITNPPLCKFRPTCSTKSHHACRWLLYTGVLVSLRYFFAATPGF